MKDIADKNGLNNVLLPVRPTLKSKYPLIPMDDYIYWENENGFPYDPWIRVHIKAGGKIIRTCNKSMSITGSILDWEEWTELKFKTSGDYIIDKALTPIKIDIDKNTGEYFEPNVWIMHEIK